MSYAFDNSPLSHLFKNFYRDAFPSLWEKFDALVDEGRILSTREVLREIGDSSIEPLRDWCEDHEEIFTTPTVEEGGFVARIFGVAHFRQNIELQKLLKGGFNADPFVIARAALAGCPVVTMERLKDNAAKIPNICGHFGVECLTLEEFMRRENWRF
jgi:hypothetical protein